MREKRLKLARIPGLPDGPKCQNRSLSADGARHRRARAEAILAQLDGRPHDYEVRDMVAQQVRSLRRRRQVAKFIIKRLLPDIGISDPLQVSQAVLERAPSLDRMGFVGHPCHYCGAPAEAIDHIWPRSRGGDDHPYNLVRACKACNSVKNARSVLGHACPSCGELRDPSDVDTANRRAFYACRCGQSWDRNWTLEDVRLPRRVA